MRPLTRSPIVIPMYSFDFLAKLHDLYVDKYQKYSEIYPFNDSDDDPDLQEFNRHIKKMAIGFKNFTKQRRQSTGMPTGM